MQVQNISLAVGETITVETLGGLEPIPLANESFLMRGQVVRGPTNQVLVRFQSPSPANPGSFHFHFEAYLLSCAFPTRPAYGDVSVTSTHPGGQACFSCVVGYQLVGKPCLECFNATHPFWSNQEPTCIAACGGVIRNATTGRIVSPGFPANYSNNLTCHWVLEASPGQRVHLHFEKVSLAEDDDRLIIRNGNNIEAPPVYDSYEVEYLPIEGLVSTSRGFFIEFSTDSGGVAAGVALRYEAFRPGHCYEPFVKYGNFTSSNGSYKVGTTVEFTCEPGYTLEQGSVIIECVDPSNPQWNETEPACRVTACPDPGDVEHSRRVVSANKFPVGSAIQFLCDKGFLLAGAGEIVCHDRPGGGPKWSDRLPKCIPEVYEPCTNPGGPEHSTQHPEKRLYQTGTTLRFTCATGYLPLGNAILRCLPGHPSRWSSPPPLCKAAVAKVMPARDPLRGSSVAFEVFLPVAAVGLLLGTVYLCISRHQGKMSLPAPLSASHAYGHHMADDSAFDNPIYETGEIPAAAYEVSI
ncbi:seizure protein 6 homolog [Pseudonaja textilis]|uniref:seizure protein 6 homolog n=1 Tax=Pseudonaja textilis TaxID=8673 RepID=UPI000EA9CFE5|nr:seizure protein 6 homolog [Pseudonaja textilis]